MSEPAAAPPPTSDADGGDGGVRANGRVILADPAAAGFDAMLAVLFEQALAKPEKALLLDRLAGTLTMKVPDVNVDVGLRFGGGKVTISPTGIPDSLVTIRSDSQTLMSLGTMPKTRRGLPDVRKPETRAAFKAVATGKIRVKGLRYFTLLKGFVALMTP